MHISGRPISALGSGNPFDGESYHSFFICTANCDSETDAVYELLRPWLAGPHAVDLRRGR